MVFNLQIAEQVHKFVNAKFYLRMLSAMNEQAKEMGYCFSDQDGVEADLTSVEHTKLGRVLFTERVGYLNPLLSESELEDDVEQALSDGRVQGFYDEVVEALKAQGIRPLRLR